VSLLRQGSYEYNEYRVSRDESWCDVGQHQACPGYTQDESDPETCLCECHSLPYYDDPSIEDYEDRIDQ
jgi:hypothetical protein